MRFNCLESTTSFSYWNRHIGKRSNVSLKYGDSNHVWQSSSTWGQRLNSCSAQLECCGSLKFNIWHVSRAWELGVNMSSNFKETFDLHINVNLHTVYKMLNICIVTVPFEGIQVDGWREVYKIVGGWGMTYGNAHLARPILPKAASGTQWYL